MKILIITGAYPPIKCGVGDYTQHLVEALAEIPEIEVGVLTSLSAETEERLPRVKVLRVMPDWKLRRVLTVSRVISEFRPDVVHIQYPTQRYNGHLPRYLPLLIRLHGIPIIQTWHEHFVSCQLLGWQNLLACDSLIYVRPDLLNKLPAWVRRFIGARAVYVPNAATIPMVKLSAAQIYNLKQELSGGMPVVSYFGFAYANKGVERLFEIADPEKHHLVLICDLDKNHPYQNKILEITGRAPWKGRVTVTGFQSAQRVGEILAASDAVVFPFPEGAGEWNTSLKAAEQAGVFTVATTQDNSLLGYHAEKNIYFAGCDKVADMKRALNLHLGTRKEGGEVDSWGKIAMVHKQIYEQHCEN